MKGEQKNRIIKFSRRNLNQNWRREIVCPQQQAAIPLANFPKEHQRSLDIFMDMRLPRWSKNFGEHHLLTCISFFMSLQYTARLHWTAVTLLLKPWQKVLIDLALCGHIHGLNSQNSGNTNRDATNSNLCISSKKDH